MITYACFSMQPICLFNFSPLMSRIAQQHMAMPCCRTSSNIYGNGESRERCIIKCHNCFKKRIPRLICRLCLLCKHCAPKPISTTYVMSQASIMKFYHCIQLSQVFIDGYYGLSCYNHNREEQFRLLPQKTTPFKQKNHVILLSFYAHFKLKTIILNSYSELSVSFWLNLSPF